MVVQIYNIRYNSIDLVVTPKYAPLKFIPTKFFLGNNNKP